MLKLRFSAPSVKTYMDGKITVCRYDCVLVDNCTKKEIIKFSATGTSRCADNDTLDADFGRKLADSRAKLTAYKVAGSFIPQDDVNRMIEEIHVKLEMIDFANTMSFLKKKEQQHIEHLNNGVTK